jgi:cephalosporin hydroxylase
MKVSDQYHIWYEKNRIWEKTRWLGIPMWKLPMDAFVIQELIFDIKPDLIIETGTGHGGSTTFYASLLQLINNDGKVITVDIEPKASWHDIHSYEIHSRIYPILGNSVDDSTFELIDEIYRKNETTMVILDSWHSYDHVLKELNKYQDYVSRGSYMIIEDTHVSGHPVDWEHGDGPYEAVEEFLENNIKFVLDRTCEKHGMSFNPGGYLRRIR